MDSQQQLPTNTTLTLDDILGADEVKTLHEQITQTQAKTASTLDENEYNNFLRVVQQRFPRHSFDQQDIRYRRTRRQSAPIAIRNYEKKIQILKRELLELQELEKYDENISKLHEEYSLNKKLNNSSGRKRRAVEQLLPTDDSSSMTVSPDLR